MFRKLFRAILWAALLSGGALLAQTEAEITGQITDSTGALIPAAKVTVTNDGTGAKRVASTDTAGVYAVPSLNPGMYSVSVEASGFRSEVRRAVELQIQQTARLDFQMQVGQLSEVVEIEGGAPLIATENATVGSVIENRRIVDLPLNGRNFLQLVSLSPNVSFAFSSDSTATARLGGTRATENIAVAGQRSEFNYFTLDGVNNTDITFNSYIFLPSIDAIQEFKVQTGVFPAEFGRATGQVNVSSKSGTNAYHGTLFEFLRNSSVDATNYSFTAVHPPTSELRQNQFGFTLGGPILIPKIFNGKNRLFFMANYEGLRENQGVNQVGTVPSVAQRSGDFSGIANTLFDPATRALQSNGSLTAAPFPGNTIPQSRFDPISVKLLNYYPTPNVPGAGLANNYQSVPAQTSTADQFTIRIDFIERSSSTWFGRYSYSNENGVTPSVFPALGLKLESYPKQATLSNIRTITPTIVNEFRFGYNHFDNYNLNANANIFNGVGLLGGFPGVAVPTPLLYGIPGISMSGLSGFGDNTSLPFIIFDNTFQATDSLSLVRGKHSFRFGAEIRRDQFNSEGNSYVRGGFTFTGFATQNPASTPRTGTSFADYLLGTIGQTDEALGLAIAQLRATSQAYFVDDSWKLRPNLTISLGLRYEYFPPFIDKHDGIANVLLPGAGSTAQPTFVRPGTGDFYANTAVPFLFGGGIQVARSNSLMGQSLIKPDKNNFAPRVGIAYSPGRNWSIRVAGGVFYAYEMANIAFDMGRNLAGRRSTVTDPSFPNLTYAAPYGGGGGSYAVTTPFVLAEGYNLPTPYVMQYLVNVQRQLTNNLVLEVGYMGNLGRKLQRLIDMNEPMPGPGNVQARRPWPAYGVIQNNEPWVSSEYNSLSVKLQQRLSHGLTAVEGYTWSRALDTGSSVRSHTSDSLFPQNPYDLNDERGMSTFNVSHRSITSLLYELPFGKGRKWLNAGGVTNAVLGGWQLGTIVTIQSGFPMTIFSGQDIANDGEAPYQRPNSIGPQNLPRGQRTPQRWFNTANFVTPPLYTWGTVGRNTVIAPGIVNLDLSVMKEFPIHEQQRFQLRFESFNGLNHPNWGTPNSTLTSPAFGTISSTQTSMRVLQVALKFIF
jgi:hypothetical protein